MTDRDELRDRLDGLEARFDTDTVDTLDDRTREQIDQLFDEDPREILPPERVDRLDELEAEVEQNGFYVDEEPDRIGRTKELTPAAKRLLSMMVGETAEYKLEKRGL